MSNNSKKKILRVQRARTSDIGKNIIRIDQRSMEQLDVQKGDIIAIKGKRESAGIVKPSDRLDENLDIVRIDLRMRKNTKTSVGDKVEIRKVKTDIAVDVLLIPINVKINSSLQMESFIKRKLNNYPITIGDLIYVYIGFNREITFEIRNLEPKSICIIKMETTLHIGELNTKEEMCAIQEQEVFSKAHENENKDNKIEDAKNKERKNDNIDNTLIKETTPKQLFLKELKKLLDPNRKYILSEENYHSKEQLIVFSTYKNLILKEDLFRVYGQELFESVKETVSKENIENRHQETQRIFHWIKKRAVIEQLFMGKCIGCITIGLEDLPLLNLIDLDNIDDRSKWQDMRHLYLSEIFEIIEKEKLICLCSICYRLIKHERSGTGISSLFDDEFNDLYNKIENNIRNFSIPKNIKPYLIEKATFQVTWIQALIDIYNYIQQNHLTEYDFVSLQKYLNIDIDIIRSINFKLIEMGFVKKVKEVKRYPKLGIHQSAKYALSEDGLKLVKNLL